jgi:hypothetical protein
MRYIPTHRFRSRWPETSSPTSAKDQQIIDLSTRFGNLSDRFADTQKLLGDATDARLRFDRSALPIITSASALTGPSLQCR